MADLCVHESLAKTSKGWTSTCSSWSPDNSLGESICSGLGSTLEKRFGSRLHPCVVTPFCVGSQLRLTTCVPFSARQRHWSSSKTTTSRARRAQRQRQSDRALVTPASANHRFTSHHGSAPMADGFKLVSGKKTSKAIIP